eukprot:gb/GFBE01081593.1/.p1 GENE.gb/GFBE01081593.1/~~gb/GFBE01081593.1/.p1  ORF type:complete len:284 (+),score=91.66 gb/GFBE01081593.1/:1-852(+)
MPCHVHWIPQLLLLLSLGVLATADSESDEQILLATDDDCGPEGSGTCALHALQRSMSLERVVLAQTAQETKRQLPDFGDMVSKMGDAIKKAAGGDVPDAGIDDAVKHAASKASDAVTDASQTSAAIANATSEAMEDLSRANKQIDDFAKQMGIPLPPFVAHAADSLGDLQHKLQEQAEALKQKALEAAGRSSDGKVAQEIQDEISTLNATVSSDIEKAKAVVDQAQQKLHLAASQPQSAAREKVDEVAKTLDAAPKQHLQRSNSMRSSRAAGILAGILMAQLL